MDSTVELAPAESRRRIEVRKLRPIDGHRGLVLEAGNVAHSAEPLQRHLAMLSMGTQIASSASPAIRPLREAGERATARLRSFRANAGINTPYGAAAAALGRGSPIPPSRR